MHVFHAAFHPTACDPSVLKAPRQVCSHRSGLNPVLLLCSVKVFAASRKQLNHKGLTYLIFFQNRMVKSMNPGRSQPRGSFSSGVGGSAANGPSVKSAGLKARGPAPLAPPVPRTQRTTVNYFTLITASGNSSSCFLVQANNGGGEGGGWPL